jgi:hypothetical protein
MVLRHVSDLWSIMIIFGVSASPKPFVAFTAAAKANPDCSLVEFLANQATLGIVLGEEFLSLLRIPSHTVFILALRTALR